MTFRRDRCSDLVLDIGGTPDPVTKLGGAEVAMPSRNGTEMRIRCAMTAREELTCLAPRLMWTVCATESITVSLA